MTPFELVTLSAAAWYIAHSVTNTHGPFGVFESIRLNLPLGGLTACIVCLMFWVGQGLALATGHGVLDGLAIAGVALWVHGYTGWRFG